MSWVELISRMLSFEGITQLKLPRKIFIYLFYYLFIYLIPMMLFIIGKFFLKK
jgi:hypothetical protein